MCVAAEEIAQRDLIQSHQRSTVVRILPAGTVDQDSKVENDCYRIFGWVFHDGFRQVNLTQCRMVLSSKEVREMRLEEYKRALPKSRNYEKTEMFSNRVRLQHLGKGSKRC